MSMALFDKPARKFFTREEGMQIVAAIRAAEDHTSGEIRVHLENRCKHEEPMDRAAVLFRRLKMDKTARRNGVLVYLAVKDHRFAILADEGINQVVPKGFWEEIASHMEAAFRAGEFLRGLTEGISLIGPKLREFFPGEANDENELSDEISFGE
jgi:uncharacterized membrane protein